MTAEQEALTQLRERLVDAIAEHAAYHRTSEPDSLPTHSIIDCPDIMPALDDLLALATAIARRDAYDRCFGQRDPDGDALLFVVRVTGIPARPESPAEIANILARQWSYLGQPNVTVADDLLADAEQAVEAAKARVPK